MKCVVRTADTAAGMVLDAATRPCRRRRPRWITVARPCRQWCRRRGKAAQGRCKSRPLGGKEQQDGGALGRAGDGGWNVEKEHGGGLESESR